MLPVKSDPSNRDAIGAATKRGYVVAAVGALAGAVTAGPAVGGTAYVLMSCDKGGWDCLGAALLAAAIGILAGLVAAVAGCYCALRLRGYDRAGRTAAIMAALLPVAGALSVALAGAVTIFGPVIGIAGAAIGARRLAIGRTQPRKNSTDNEEEIT